MSSQSNFSRAFSKQMHSYIFTPFLSRIIVLASTPRLTATMSLASNRPFNSYLPITSASCVFGIAAGIASCLSLLWVACSYANA